MENKMNIQGYLECDGTITKISSLDDIQAFITKQKSSENLVTEDFLDNLITINDKTEKDDCDVTYLQSLPVLKKAENGFIYSSYKVRKGTVGIADMAFCFEKGSVIVDGRTIIKRNCLSAIYLPDSIFIIGKAAFSENFSLCTLNMPKNLIKIADYAFKDCVSLVNTSLPQGLLYIGRSAFENSGIKEITIPSSVQRINSLAFANCRCLKSVVFKGCPMNIESAIFEHSPVEKIVIPTGTMDYYKKALFEIDSNVIQEL